MRKKHAQVERTNIRLSLFSASKTCFERIFLDVPKAPLKQQCITMVYCFRNAAAAANYSHRRPRAASARDGRETLRSASKRNNNCSLWPTRSSFNRYEYTLRTNNNWIRSLNCYENTAHTYGSRKLRDGCWILLLQRRINRQRVTS